MIAVRIKYFPLFAVMAVSLTIGACSPRLKSTWQKPGATQDDRNSDKINCMGLARRKVDREARAEASQAGPGAYRSATSLPQAMKRYEAKKRQRALYEACLKSRGFEKSTPKDGKGL